MVRGASRAIPTLQLLGDRHQLDLRGALVDAQHPSVPIAPFDLRLAQVAGTAVHLQRVIRDSMTMPRSRRPSRSTPADQAVCRDA